MANVCTPLSQDPVLPLSPCGSSQLPVSPLSDLVHGHVQRVHYAPGWTSQVLLCCHLRLGCYGIVQLHQRVRRIKGRRVQGHMFSGTFLWHVYDSQRSSSVWKLTLLPRGPRRRL